MANWTTGLSSEQIAEHYFLKVDTKPVEQALAGTTKSLPSIARQTVGIIARGGVKQIKAIIKPHRDTGEMYKAYRYKVKKNGTATIFPHAINEKTGAKIFPKCSVQSYGHMGPTRRAKSFRIKALRFMQTADQWIEQGAYMPEVEKMIDKTLAKYWS